MAGYRTASAGRTRISVDDGLCKACGICAHACPTDVFEMQPTGFGARPVPTAVEDCIECGKCELLCPDFALDVAGDD